MRQLTAVPVFSASARQNCTFNGDTALRITRLSLTYFFCSGSAANNCTFADTGVRPSLPIPKRQCKRDTPLLAIAGGPSIPPSNFFIRQWNSDQINSFLHQSVPAGSVYPILVGRRYNGVVHSSHKYLARFASTLIRGKTFDEHSGSDHKCSSLGGDSGLGDLKQGASARAENPPVDSEGALSSTQAYSADSDCDRCTASPARVNSSANSDRHLSASSLAASRSGDDTCSAGSSHSLIRDRPAGNAIKLADRKTSAPRVHSTDNSCIEMEQATVCEFFPTADHVQCLQVTNGSHPIVDEAFEKLVDSLTGIDDPRLKDFADWLRRVIEYNVPEGKRNRLMAVMLAYQSLENEEITNEKLELAALLGWCVELLQAYFLICDDIMDHSLTRRGKTCWYLIEGVQMMAINDAILCETAIYRILKTFFRNHPHYLDLLELFHEVSFQTSSGQCLDMLAERNGGGYLEERYNAIVLYKTAFYSFSLPIRLGMYLAGIADQLSHKKAEALALRIGHIFQIQDDFLDCYGVPEVIGKVGTDIVDAKCSWLVVKALQIATPEQKKTLLENYGKGKPGGPEEAVIKKLYDELDLAEVFRKAEERAFADIRDEVTKLQLASESTALNTEIFKLLVNKIYRRNK